MATSDPGVEQRPLSIIEGRDPLVLSTMLDFYANPGARVLDVTANERRMWSGVSWSGKVVYLDIDPVMRPDVVADFRALPFESSSFDVIVFDPPHLPAAAASPMSMQRFASDYGLGHAPHANNCSAYFAPFLCEAARVLRPDGLVFAKLKDFVHNHAYQWTLADWIAAAREQDGLTPCDLIVKKDPSGGALKSSKWQKAHHVRNAHCWWAVIRKGRCEASATASSARQSCEVIEIPPPVRLPDYKVCWRYVCASASTLDLVLLPEQIRKPVLNLITNCPGCGCVVHPFRAVEGWPHFAIDPACPDCAERQEAREHAAWLQAQLTEQRKVA